MLFRSEELETALLMADTGVKATEHLLSDLRRRVKQAQANEPAQVKALLTDAVAELAYDHRYDGGLRSA